MEGVREREARVTEITNLQMKDSTEALVAAGSKGLSDPLESRPWRRLLFSLFYPIYTIFCCTGQLSKLNNRVQRYMIRCIRGLRVHWGSSNLRSYVKSVSKLAKRVFRCPNSIRVCKLSVAQLVRFLVVEPAHPDSNPRFGTGARIFLN